MEMTYKTQTYQHGFVRISPCKTSCLSLTILNSVSIIGVNHLIGFVIYINVLSTRCISRNNYIILLHTSMGYSYFIGLWVSFDILKVIRGQWGKRG